MRLPGEWRAAGQRKHVCSGAKQIRLSAQEKVKIGFYALKALYYRTKPRKDRANEVIFNFIREKNNIASIDCLCSTSIGIMSNTSLLQRTHRG